MPKNLPRGFRSKGSGIGVPHLCRDCPRELLETDGHLCPGIELMKTAFMLGRPENNIYQKRDCIAQGERLIASADDCLRVPRGPMKSGVEQFAQALAGIKKI